MIDKAIMELIIAVAISVSGAIGYMHGMFASKYEVETLSKSIHRVDNLLCKMAINQNVKDAVSICTEKGENR